MADDQNTTALPADDTAALPPAEELDLPEGEEKDLPDGYEIAVDSEEDVVKQVADAEAFGDTLVSIQNLIRRYSEQYDEINGKMKELRESLKNLFENDEELQKLEVAAKTTTTDVKQKKQRIKESPEAVQLQMKVKEFQEEMGEIAETLNNHLLRYFQMTGSQVLDEPDGTEREFTVKARLKAKKHTA